MKHKSKNKGKGFTETEREAQLSSQVFVLSELLDMTSTIIEELRTGNDCLVDENNDYSEFVCSLHRKIKKLKRKNPVLLNFVQVSKSTKLTEQGTANSAILSSDC